MPRRLRLLLLGGVALGALAFGNPAQAAVQTLVFRTGAVTLEPFEVAQSLRSADSPSVDGYVVGMSADVVDADGNVLPMNRVMLHHVVFAKIGMPDYTCGAMSTFPAERFYATGEERTGIQLPAGYGYPNKGSDHWGLLYMLMNHHNKKETVYIRYTVDYVTGQTLISARPVWLDIHNCSSDPVFDIPGTGGPGSSYSRHADFRMPESGHLIWGGGHLHGGGLRLELSDRGCKRSAPVFTSLPTWGSMMPRPIMHEPGPMHMSNFSSTPGIPVAAGHTLRLKAVYDNSYPHTRVMGIMLLYFVPGAVSGCEPVPPLDEDMGMPGKPPRVILPLLKRPTGPVQKDIRGTWVGDYRYGAQRVSIKRGTTFHWRFIGKVGHNVTLASGPIGFSSPTLLTGTFSHRFTTPGVYKLFCSIHPTRMTELIRVR
jgi:plastocyanin